MPYIVLNCSHVLKSLVCCLAILGTACDNSSLSVSPSPSEPVIQHPIVTPSAPSVPSPIPPRQKSEALQTFEKRLRGEIIKKAGITVQTVSCPIETDVNAQTVFMCEAIAEGKPFTVVVNPQKPANGQPTTGQSTQLEQLQKNTQPDKNELRWSTKGLLVLPKLEQTIRQGIQKEFQLEVTATCGGKVRIAKPGETFQCQLKDSRGQTRSVTVRVEDDLGNVTWRLS